MILLSPIVMIFVYPLVFMCAVYACAVFLRVYRHKRRAIFDAYATNFWDGATQAVAAIVDAHGEFWHGRLTNHDLGDIFFTKLGINVNFFTRVSKVRSIVTFIIQPLLIESESFKKLSLVAVYFAIFKGYYCIIQGFCQKDRNVTLNL